MHFFLCRRSQAVLTKCLPKKEEHIILVNMSPIQKELYNGFVEGLLGSVGHVNPIKGFHTCTKVSIFLAQSNLQFIYFLFHFLFYQLFWTQVCPEGIGTNGTHSSQARCHPYPNPTTREGWPHHWGLRPLLFSISESAVRWDRG